MNKPTQTKQSPHWADSVVAGIKNWQQKNTIPDLHVDDMKTPSGRVHTGALRGVLLHDIISQILKEQGIPHKNTYVFNDMDPMDGLPGYLDEEKFKPEMGKPLYRVLVPELGDSGINLDLASPEELEDFRSAKNFAEFYARDFVHALRKLGCSQEIVWSHELYESGQMDKAITVALDNTEKIKKVYREVADYELPDDWYPYQAICEQCGKVGTTLTTGWDGKLITYECQPDKVTWAQGCGHQGSLSPFGGTGKLLWKVDWPAHWYTMGVNIEGAGKDHTSAGGSRDMANALCEDVYEIHAPYDVPYEWILVRGAKMSSSKGVGTSAREFTNLFPPEVGRYLFVAKNYNQVIDFDPRTMAIPDLFDEYDQAAKIYWGEESGDERMGRSFVLSQLSNVPKQQFLPRFRDVALWMQYPEMNLPDKFAEVKGSTLTDGELRTLEQRQQYARIWVEMYAPEEYQLTVTENMPPAALQLTEEQENFFLQIASLTTKQDWQPEDLQQTIYELAKVGIGARQGFGAIYQALLGKTAGPKAAWLLLSTPSALLEKRVQQLKKEH